jgi:circadian clock protein KaiB
MATVSAGRYFLRLYVAGANARSRQALRRVFQMCEDEQKNNYELEVIDVYQQPELARQDQIVATPTLVKCLPLPVRRYIGNLSDTTGLFGEEKLMVKIPEAP